MGCGCRKRKTNDSRTAVDTSGMRYEVWRNGVYTGRAFTSLVQAQSYANSVSGEVIQK